MTSRHSDRKRDGLEPETVQPMLYVGHLSTDFAKDLQRNYKCVSFGTCEVPRVK
jgi:hypothetical protein